MTYWLYRAITALPLALSYRLASLISWLTQYVIRYRVETVDRNLRAAFPEQTDAWYSETRKRFYKQFAEVTVESLYGWRMPKAELEERMKLIGWEPLLASSDESPKPGILLSIHHGNWEWLVQRSSLAASAPFDGVYKPLHDKGADRFALESRGRWGGTLVTMKAMGRHVLRNRRTPRVLALLADQAPGKKETAHWTTFMNQPAGFFLGPATLANITQYPVYFVRVQRVGRGYYEIELIEICKEPGSLSQEELIERYVELAEETIRLEPESYLWSNRRWKRTPPQEFLADQATLTESKAESGDIQSNP